MKLYFERHDGQAVTCDDFAQAQADANPGSDLASCCRSSSAGTARPARHNSRPSGHYDAAAHTYTLTLEQSCAPTPGQARQAAVRDPAEPGPGRAGWARPAAAIGRRIPARRWSRTFVISQASETLTFVTGVDRTRALAAARLQRTGGAGLRLHRRHSCCTCWPTTATRSTAGRPASAWPCAPRSRPWAKAPAPGCWARRSSRPCAASCVTPCWMPPSRNWC
jgi:hypothetical protein